MTSCLRALGVSRFLAVLPALFLGLTGGVAIAAEASVAGEVASVATPPAVEDLIELDEVWVRGKSLTRLIEEAENALFARYNELNTNDSYDVHCGDAVLYRGSLIMTRTCVPGFLAGRAMSRRYSRAGGGDYTPQIAMAPSVTCYGLPSVGSGDGGVYFEGGCYGSLPGYSGGYPSYGSYYGGTGSSWDSYYASFGGMGAVSDRQLDASMMQLEAVHRRQEYSDTVLKVIQGDQQLLEMAQELALLYGDMELAQQRYKQIRTERGAALPRNLGPRVPAPR